MMIQLSEKITVSEQLGKLIKHVRRENHLTQQDVALTANCGLRFLIELEQGKPTCQLGKVLKVMQVLGIVLTCSYLVGKESKK